MKIKAAVVNAVGLKPPFVDSRPYSIEEMDLDRPGPGEVLVRIMAAGVCHSEIPAVTVGGTRGRRTPFVPGHEAAGVITELGPDVTGIEAGDHVIVSVVADCGVCASCVRGHPTLCELGWTARAAGTLRSGMTRLSSKGSPVQHFCGVSAFAESAVVGSGQVVKIDKDVPFEVAALFGCAVLTGVGAVVNVGRLQPGDSAAVIGLGGVGLSGLLGARMSGARRLVAIDLDERKLELARSLGATDVFNAKSSDCAEAILSATAGGLDMVFEYAGSTKALELAYAITRRGGTTVTAGLAPSEQVFPLPHQSFVTDQRTLKGCLMGDAVPKRDIPRWLELYRNGGLPIDKLVSARIEPEDLNVALDRLEKGETVRQVVSF